MPRTGTFRSAWGHRRWRRFLQSLAVSSAGEFLSTVALVVYLIDETGSATWVAASFIARMGAFTLLGPLGGVLADRFDRRRLMVALDVARLVIMLAVAAIVAAGGSPALVIALVAVVAALTTPYRPAAVAATPLLVPLDDLAAANAAEASVMQLAWFAGPAVGAAVVGVSGPAAAFVVNGAAFAVSAVLVAGIGAIGGGRRTRSSVAVEPARVLAQIAGGFRALGRLPGVAVLTVFSVATLFAYGLEQVVHVLVADDRLGLGPDGVGVLNACMGAGGMIAIPFSAWLASRRETGLLLAGSGVLMGLPLALLAVVTSPVVAGALMVFEGVGNIVFDVVLITLLQRICPEVLLGRVFAVQDSCGSLAQLVGMVAAPMLVASLQLEATLWIGGGTLVVTALVLVPALRTVAARAEVERRRLAPLVAELGASALFAEASVAARERIARSARVVQLAAGTVVFREGDPPDDLYVVRSGTLVVAMADRGEIRRLGPGEWFGEIGLLRGVRRTASVAVLADAELIVVGGAEFLDAVTGSNRLPEPVAGAMALRLAATHPHLVEPAP